MSDIKLNWLEIKSLAFTLPTDLFKEVSSLRKSGDLEMALDMAQKAYESDSDDVWNKRALAWVYYDYIKLYTAKGNYQDLIDYLGKINALTLSNKESMFFDNCAWQIGKVTVKISRSDNVDYVKLNQLFNVIKSFHFSRPSEQFSFIYKSFHKAYKNWNQYLDFADWWDFKNFQPQDYLKEEFKGKKIMALVEQAYIAYSKKLLEALSLAFNEKGRNEIKHKISMFIPKLEDIIKEHPEYQYPPYFYAKLLLAIGDEGNIFSAFLPFAKQKKNDFWVWELMAEIFDNDKDMQIACYCKALSLKTPEDFLVKIRERFAELLIEKEFLQEAKTEIKKLVKTRKDHGWSITNRVEEWQKQEWYSSTKSYDENTVFYAKHSPKAHELLYQDIPEEFAVIEFVNTSKKILNFIVNESRNGCFNYSQILRSPKIGDIIKVRLGKSRQGRFYEVYSASFITDNIDHPAVKKFSGTLEVISPQNFGFVDNIFFHPSLIVHNQLSNLQSVSGKAVLSFNKKKDEWGWKAIRVIIEADN